jgi:hypothetical protein
MRTPFSLLSESVRDEREVEELEAVGESKGEWPVELGSDELAVAVRRVTGLDLTADEDMAVGYVRTGGSKREERD